MSSDDKGLRPAAGAGDGLFIAWTRFQRRAAVLAARLDLDLRFVHYSWEGANRPAKALSYLAKAIQTIRLLAERKPRFVMLQLPPTPALYVCALYARIFKVPLIVDCHNAAIMEHWSRWPLTATILKRATVVAHNDHVAELAARAFDVQPFVLRTGIMSVDPSEVLGGAARDRLKLGKRDYVLLPWSLHTDEPIAEALEAIRQMPDQRFVLTGDARKLPAHLAANLPSNLTVPGYLPTAEFNDLFAHAAAVLVLTTRDLTQLSGMAEAMAFEIPAVISDTATTRYLYGTAPIYVLNQSGAIREGILEALQNADERVLELRALRKKTEAEFESQVATLVSTIANAQSRLR